MNIGGGQVYVSFSGGKDSTVLLSLVRDMYPDVPAVFFDTGLEYPEIRDFVKTFDNVVWLKPKKTFKKVIEEYGYPVVSKNVSRFVWDLRRPNSAKNENVKNLRLTGYNQKGEYCPSMKLSNKWTKLVDAPFDISDKCCDIMKKDPAKRFVKESESNPIIGTLAEESRMRTRVYLRTGCNAFECKNPYSMPMSFWTNQDILAFLKKTTLNYCSVYGDIKETNDGLILTGEQRTGCMFCMFGVHMENNPNRFQRMAITHPTQYKYCMENLGLKEILEYIGVEYKPSEQIKLF
ncbi:MAG: phosphoadenosine phosphosulfate reductase family protein [Phycisphaerae bacterium]|jgi:3'-phosphoadenosine 5'-phosphosulfate sulfotransferase (PAPS reductase)/FAD synthetase